MRSNFKVTCVRDPWRSCWSIDGYTKSGKPRRKLEPFSSWVIFDKASDPGAERPIAHYEDCDEALRDCTRLFQETR